MSINVTASEQESFIFVLEGRGRRNGAEPYQKAILTGSGYRSGGITCAGCGHIWADKDAHEDPYATDETDNDKTVCADAEKAV